jgi:nitrogenase molybdenum-iron protein alpha/beta subunit
LGPTALGFRHRDDVEEISRLLRELGVEVNVVAPLGADPSDIARLHEADFNVNLYPETANTAITWMTRNFGQPSTKVIPIGFKGTQAFIAEVCQLADIDCDIQEFSKSSKARWYALSVDSTYLTNKRVFIFGDATHAIAAAKVAAHEMGFKVVGLGTYSRELAREVREAAAELGLEAIITDDYLEVEEKIKQAGEGSDGQTELSRAKLRDEFVVSYSSDVSIQKKVADKIDAIFAEIDKATAAAETNAKNADFLLNTSIEYAAGAQISNENIVRAHESPRVQKNDTVISFSHFFLIYSNTFFYIS